LNRPRRLLGLVLGRRLPRIQGTLRLEGPREQIVIHRDRYGIPHVEAGGDEDAAFALGFCHGQDRAFQLELLLRLARGTLAELVGKRALPVDRLSRRVGLRRGAEAQLAASGAELERLLRAYALGVTEGATIGSARPAHEFSLLRERPSEWRAADVLAVNRLIAFLLASNWDAELARLKILLTDGPDAVAALEGVEGESRPAIAPAAGPIAETVDRLAEDLERLSEIVPLGAGSNSWVVDGTRTASGRPLLANDPHLAPTLPPHWYLVHLRTPAWEVAGGSYVGTPAVLVGFNGQGAWGVTAGLSDNTDLYLEELEGDLVRDGDGLVRCERYVEVIRVRGSAPVREEVLVTPNGPIISPALEGVGVSPAISLRATWLEARRIVGFVRAHRARSFEEFRRCFEHWPAVPLNLAWADTSGTIGWQLVGSVPVRGRGHGTMPGPGWDPAGRWESEPVPFDEMPHLAGAETGMIVTANNRPVVDGGRPYLGADWIDGYRAARIGELLESRDDWDVQGMQQLQLDLVSLPWRQIRDVLLTAPAAGEDACRGRDLLAGWNGRVSADSSAAAVYELVLGELLRRVVRAKAPRSSRWALGRGFHVLAPATLHGRRRIGQLVSLLREQPAGWLERTWPEEIADSLAAVVRRLRAQLGEDDAGWSWGRVRPVRLRHPLGAVPPFRPVFDLGPTGLGGDATTVAQAAVDVSNPTAPPTAIPSLRAVIDVGDWEASRFSLPGGQSGNPCSSHYDDLLPLWQAGSGVPIAWSADSVRAATVATLRLVPAPRGLM
jgi:penicillin amidase